MTQAPPPTPSMIAHEIRDIIANVREHADIMNRRWGFNRLPHLVSLDLMAKFQRQKQKWEFACFECTESMLAKDLQRVRDHGEAMKRAYVALEAEATKLGHSPTPPGVWEFELSDGTPIALVRTQAERSTFDRQPKAQVWCLEEIAQIIEKYPQLVLAKEHFPDAELITLSPSKETVELVDDCLSDIPWGG